MDIGYRAVDADNHYYETLDACTRHLDKEFRRRGVQVGAAGQAHAPARGRQALPLHPEPHVRPDHRRRLHGPDVPRPDPRGRRPALAHEGRAAAARVPGPRRASRGDGRAGPRSRARCSRRSRAASSRRCATTSPPPWRRCTRSTAGSTRTGASRTRTGSSRCRCSRSPTPTPPSRSWSGCSSGARAWCTSGPRPCRPPTVAAGRSAIPRTTPCGRASPRPTCPVAFHLGDSGYEMFAGGVGRPRLVRAVPRRRRRAQQARRVRPADPRHDRQHGRGRRVRPPPDAARRQHRERLRLGAAPGEAPAQAGEPDAVGVPRRARSRRSGEHVWVTPYYEEDMRKLADLVGAEHGALRLRLAPRRGPGRPDSTSSRSSTRSPTTRCAS